MGTGSIMSMASSRGFRVCPAVVDFGCLGNGDFSLKFLHFVPIEKYKYIKKFIKLKIFVDK